MVAVAIETPRTTKRTGASAGRVRRAREAARARVAAGDAAGPAATPELVLGVRPAPPLDPPFDDAPQPPNGMELLPVDWSGADVERRQISALKRGLPRPGDQRGDATQLRDASQPGSPTQPGGAVQPPVVAARAALQRYVGMCVEVLNGYRPTAHLRPITDLQRFNDVADQLVRRTVRVRMPPGQAARHGRLVRVRRMLVCEPLDGIAEAAVVLEQGDACWAMAVRMERDPDRSGAAGGWRCTIVRVI
jgi:hypothetical protein